MIKIIDFGFADISSESQGEFGTPNFMAPEIILARSSKNKTYSAKQADMWSLGVTMYYMCTG